jgi:hypothetical protein
MQARAEATERHEAMIRLVPTIASNITPGPAQRGESHTELTKLWCRRAWREHFKCNPPMRVLKSDPTRGNLPTVLGEHPDMQAAQGRLATTGALPAKAFPSPGISVSTRNPQMLPIEMHLTIWLYLFYLLQWVQYINSNYKAWHKPSRQPLAAVATPEDEDQSDDGSM